MSSEKLDTVGKTSRGPDDDPEARLALRIHDGDPAAESELVERFGAGLRYLLRRWTRDSSVADDIYQESFRLAIEKIRAGELRDPTKLRAFLRGLARTLSTRYYQRDGRWSTADPGTERADPTQSQLDGLLRQETSRRVRGLLAELPQGRDRELLLRFYVAEERKEEICADLGLSDLHFNRVLFRARRRFRKICEDHRVPR